MASKRKPKLKSFLVCRSFVTRMRWEVKARNKKEALAMLDQESAYDNVEGSTPWELGDEEWLGPYSATLPEENEDNCLAAQT